MENDKELLYKELDRVTHLITTYQVVKKYHKCDSWQDVFEKEFDRLYDLKDAIEVAIENLKNYEESSD